MNSDYSKTPEESPTVCNCSNQERRRDKMPAPKVSVQSVTGVISRRVTTHK